MVTLNHFVCKKPHFPSKGVWFFMVPVLALLLSSCTKEVPVRKASLIIKTGTTYTADHAYIPVGGTIRIGVLASGAGVPLTYIRIEKITSTDTLTQLDRGIYVGREGLDADYVFSKDTASVELWRILVMNSDRDTAVRTITVFRGSGTAYGTISSFENIKLGFQNSLFPGHFLDVKQGTVFDGSTVNGHEGEVDLLAYYYVTSGLPSPTFICPAYVSVVGYYPMIAGWPVKNSTVYDYYTSDNNLISVSEFDAAQDDSLLVTAFKPDKVSGNCKYAYIGKVIPFKTQAGKFGLIKVINAEQKEDGVMEISIKVQK